MSNLRNVFLVLNFVLASSVSFAAHSQEITGTTAFYGTTNINYYTKMTADELMEVAKNTCQKSQVETISKVKIEIETDFEVVANSTSANSDPIIHYSALVKCK